MPFILSSGFSRGVAVARKPAPQAPLALPDRQAWAGDSQTGGRASDTPTAVHPRAAFQNIWTENSLGTIAFASGGVGWGVSGRSLQNTFAFLAGETLTGPLAFFIQESGDQNNDGQRSASEFAATLKAGIIALNTDYPGSVFLYETAFNFGRDAETWRNWDSYNAILSTAVSELASEEGIALHVAPVAAVIQELDTLIDPGLVWYQEGETNAYHYTGIGNFAVAMTHLRYQGHDIESLLHTSVELNEPHKAAAIAAVMAVMP